MDANKRLVLLSLPYTIEPVCGLCKHADLSPSGWGTCKTNEYMHEKHSESKRQLSINAYGSCPMYEQAVDKIEMLGGFKEFAQ